MELKGTKPQRLQWVLVFLAHMILLYWMYYALAQGGTMTVLEMVLHFLGMGSYGALLITISAWLGRRNFRLEQEKTK